MKSIACLVPLAMVAGCAGAPPSGEPMEGASSAALEVGTVPPVEIYDACRDAAADATWLVPQYAPSIVQKTSGSGYYGYRECPFWLYDVKMSADSNCPVDPETGQKLCSYYEAEQWHYDLPSSAWDPNKGGMPTNAEDCARWTLNVRAYVKLAGDAGFTKVYASTATAVWNAGSATCVAYPKTVWGTPPKPDHAKNGGWDTYRFATQVKLRSSFQEVATQLQSFAN